MNIFNLFESPKLGAPSNRPGAQEIGDQHAPSPIGSGTSRREAKKKPVTMMGVGVKESKITEIWEPLSEGQIPNFLDDDFYAYDPETGEIKRTWSHKSVGRRHAEYQAQQQGWSVVSGMRAKSLGLHYPDKGVAEGILGDREYNRVMPVVKRIAGEVSDYDRDEFGEELWSLLDQKYGSKFAQSVLQDSLDFYWDTYTELTGQQGVEEGWETEPVKFNPGDSVTYQGAPAEVMSVAGNTVTLRLGTGVKAVPANTVSTAVAEVSAQDRLYQRHQELRKKSGLPDPDYYKELRATYDLPDAERYAKAAELKKKYNVKEGILDRSPAKLPKPRNPAERVLRTKVNAAGQHTNKKRQQQLQPKHRSRDEIDESLKSKLAGAALAGAMATGAAAGNLPDLVGKVTMNVDGQQVTKEFNLGNDYSSPMAAQKDLERFLRDKGVTNFYIELQRAAPDNKFQPQDTRPGPYGARSVAGPGGVVDTTGQVVRDIGSGDYRSAAEKAYKMQQQNRNADMGAIGRAEVKDRIVRGIVGGLGLDESELNEEMERHLYQLDAAGYDVISETEAIKGADGKRCWKGKRYAGTKNGKDICVDVNEEKKGLYYYVNQRKKKGISRPKGHEKAPSAQDWKDAAKTAKK